MAAALQSRRGLSTIGKRLLGQIRSRDSLPIAPPLSLSDDRGRGVAKFGDAEKYASFLDSGNVPFSKSVHNSVYEKNHDENIHANMVPDHVMPPQPEVYWAPHPKTGVFGPTTGLSDEHDASAAEDSVLEQKTFFRPLEDLDKPPVQP